MAASASSSKEMVAYKKAELPDETGAIHKKKKENRRSNINDTENEAKKEVKSEGKNKGKKNYVPLFNKSGQQYVMQLPGRHPCKCQASKHTLIGNCLNCGRVVCDQEGSGSCFTCGKLVCTREEKEIIRRNDQKGEQLRKKLQINLDVGGLKNLADELEGRNQEGLSKAIEQKNLLLEYDKQMEKRTRVIDDNADYFNVNSNRWLSKDEKNVLRKRFNQLHEQRHSRNSKITLDFAGRRVVEEEHIEDVYTMNDPVLHQSFHKSNNREIEGMEADPLAISNFRPLFETEETLTTNSTSGESGTKSRNIRIQDRQLLEMSDKGECLSILQPYASLLIAGIKKLEGRSWYTPHRGRLWIMSGNKQPTTQDIRAAESAAKIYNDNDCLVFPEQYPVGCLLGCVNLIDCISQEQYREENPDGMFEDAYIWICEDPSELVVKFPIKGRRNLFTLDSRIHQAAQKTLKSKF